MQAPLQFDHIGLQLLAKRICKDPSKCGVVKIMTFDAKLHGICGRSDAYQGLDPVVCLLVELIGHGEEISCHVIALLFQGLIRVRTSAAPLDDDLSLRSHQCRHSSLMAGHVVQQLLY